MDGLYIRLTSPEDSQDGFSEFINAQFSDAEVWMTGVTLQGNGDGQRDCSSCGLLVGSDASVYAEGVLPVCSRILLFACARKKKANVSAALIATYFIILPKLTSGGVY